MDDWTVSTYEELCIYWDFYTNGHCPDAEIVERIEKEMKRRKLQETFGKTIH